MHALAGGLQAWSTLAPDGSPAPTFDTSGRNFSLAVRAQRHTPVVTAAELQQRAAGGADVVVLDTRTLPEYSHQHVPGAIAVPAAELLLRLSDLVPSPDTQVVVSCAGLPRAILGAQTLIDAGLPNPVAYLEDGTAGWIRAGLPLETGATHLYGPASRAARENGARLARQLAQRNPPPQPIAEIDLDTARAWQADGQRTTYLLDVRTPAEFEASHLPGTLSSEGGQLVAVSHRTIAVRGARVVLIDDPAGARAQVVAHWLSQRGHGYEIAILRHDFAAGQNTPRQEEAETAAG
ncbi:MAG: Thiosulfate sulfurtransferase GlpE [Paracidovorax wautersii]|uniref:Thiosulfate sulfurtransferase GlpE n=1 Tax=Paracidovorax wautersii TaxID=1177982 RepID=A0A7V8JQ89_9BURK|nr:MAG: Thiosulfate sulfurtransferase GlpE [Paracidovorax wautersii]